MAAETLLIAIGNEMRRDDGVAGRVLELLPAPSGFSVCRVLQLTPEIAVEIATASRVVFVDADIAPGEARLEPVGTTIPAALAHAMAPAEIVALSRRLFGFHGEAWVCRVPGADFGAGVGLSPRAEANAHAAVHLLETLSV